MVLTGVSLTPSAVERLFPCLLASEVSSEKSLLPSLRLEHYSFTSFLCCPSLYGALPQAHEVTVSRLCFFPIREFFFLCVPLWVVSTVVPSDSLSFSSENYNFTQCI